MSIKMRLLLSYLAMTFIPVALFALIAHSLTSAFFMNMSGTETGKELTAFWNQRNELVAGVKFLARTEPDRFTDSGFLKNTDAQLNDVHAGLVVLKNNQITFVSSFVDSPDLLNQLQGLRTNPGHNLLGNPINGGYTAERFDITFSDHSSGTVYVLSDVNFFIETAKKFLPVLVLSLFAVIALTNGLLTFLVSRSLIKPLYSLKNAAEQIKEGNLEQAVKVHRKDEIGKLGAAFEEMRIRLKDSLRLQLQYEENRKELISNISHDLKTPITGIKACVEGIQDGIADTAAKREKYINMIAKKTEEMDRLIDELFLFSKLDLKRMPFHMEPLDLAAYLRDYVEEQQMDPSRNGMTITFSFTGELPVSVLADREKLRRVIMNIMENSLKYNNKEQKEIRVELIDGKDEVTVRIQDNGPGIDNESLPYIFDRFYRADPSRNTATGGSGLGLAIVKQIVEGHGGRVWASSRIGEGTNIYFTLRKTSQGGVQS